MSLATTMLSRNAQTPTGPDPYKLVASDLEHIKSSIKKVLSDKGSPGAISSNEVLSMAAREFMDRKGKSFRPMLVLLVGRATNPDFALSNLHYKLAVIAEMIHTASLIHDDVLEDGETDTSQGTLVHQEVALDVGNKVCILAGDFLLAKAAVELSLLDSSPVTEIVARGLESIMEGDMMTAEYTDGGDDALDAHLHIVRRRSAELIGNACQCSAILSGHEADSTVAQACLLFGNGIAMAQALVAEAEATEALLKQSRRSPKKFPHALPLSAPLLVAAGKYPEVHALLERGFSSSQDAAAMIEYLDASDAVGATLRIATEHAQNAVEALEALPISDTRKSLLVLSHKVLTGARIKP